MSKQTINIGASPNDGTGTPLRTSFDFTNQNFTELYTATGPSGNNIVVPGNATITGDLTVDTSTLKVDTTLNRVGIGTATPTTDLDIFRASGSGITSGISLRTAAGAGGDGSFIKWLSGGTNEKVAQIDGVLNGTDVGYLSFLCGNGLDVMAEQYRIASSGVFTWFNGAGGTRMTLNSTGLGIGVSPITALSFPIGTTKIVAQSAVTPHLAGNAGTMKFGIADGGGDYSGMHVVNSHGGTYSSQDLLFFTGEGGVTLSLERMRITRTGNVGIGVTPSAWLSALQVLQVKGVSGVYGAGSSEFGSVQNCFFNASSQWIYGTTAAAGKYAISSGVHQWYIAPSGTAGTPITFTQAMTLDASGALLVGPTSANVNGGCLQLKSGVTFPATQVASSDANTLDDYEEGTWVPTVGGTSTYTANQKASYIKVGRLVTVSFDMEIILIGTGSTVSISGLPFVVGSVNHPKNEQCNGAAGYFQSLAVNVFSITFNAAANTSVINSISMNTLGGTANVNPPIYGNGTRVQGTVTYMAA